MITDIISQFDIYIFLVILHIAGTAIGAGGATLSDLIFFRSIDDGKIDEQEFNLMKLGGVAVWGGLSILILSGAGIVAYQYFVNDVLLLATASKLQAKLVIVAIIAGNGIFLHAKVLPLFKKSVGHDVVTTLAKHRKAIFTSGAVSVVSWYSALIIGAWRGLSVSPILILGVYFVVLICAIVTAQLVGRIKIKQLRKKDL